jgi:hypothetical protein
MFGVIVVGSLLGFAFGFLMMFGGMMSDAPAQGNADANGGFILIVICVVLFILSFVGRHYGVIH